MKTSTSHTPGPWYFKHACGSVAEVVPHDMSWKASIDGVVMAEPNARLIAAAPELLEALRNLLDYANKYSDTMAAIGRGATQLGELADSVSVSGMARAAIAKAEGR